MTGQLASIFSTSGILIGTILPFLVVLTVVVFIHEMGHYLVGRWCGIGVKAFSIGFGPEIFGFNDRRGTRWKLSAIPLGGYVKFVGDMNATSTPTPEGEASLTDAERAVAFHIQAVWKRAATVAAGPLANFLLTIVVFSMLFATYGRVVLEPVVAEVQAGSPADRGGFMPGDRFVTVNGHKVETFGDVQYYVQALGGDEVTFGMLRNGADVTLKATPELKEQKDGSGGTVRVAIIGVVNNKTIGQPRVIAYSPGAAVVEGVKETGSVLARTGQFLKRFAAGREDKCQLGGPIKIAKMSGQAAKDGLSRLVELMALLSVGIGFLNLLPIPPLDGGHLAFYAIEAVIRRPVTERVMEAVYRVGLFAVLGFMAFVFWNDLFGC